LKSYTT